MKKDLNNLHWDREQLWKGCILASLAHSIMVAHYPELSNEQSWDGLNYSVQDSSGTRGTIAFSSDYVVAAFRNDHSERLNQVDINYDAIRLFAGAPQVVIEIAESETLQYLLDDIEGFVKPLITSSFWWTDNICFSVDSQEILLEQGVHVLEHQFMDFEDAIDAWQEYYGMLPGQIELLISLYSRKIARPMETIVLSKKEINSINSNDDIGLKESKESFGEIGIILA
ncbi:hypothetical protein [Paenibacillus sinopodophylli]|uniref:hypothetical protein n=1 Tax=Paenibacillus sinopodophylli TaxID=1837342 RepID=UPI00110D13AD|nr:hypothetical protein [Paenibacillus sinopodophylli]